MAAPLENPSLDPRYDEPDLDKARDIIARDAPNMREAKLDLVEWFLFNGGKATQRDFAVLRALWEKAHP